MSRFLLVAVILGVSGTLALAQGEQPATPQRNLVNFFNKCRAGGLVTVAYIGGSITAQNGWRPMTTKWLQQRFPQAQIKEVNAAIGGTGSYLGVFRLYKHVMQYNPDLVFVEFAVNDNGGQDAAVKATMEGIVRQIWSAPKKPDIVFTYTTAHDLKIPTARHQAVADAYGISTVDFQKTIHAVVDPGYIDWFPILAADRVHPNDWGHALYAATLATFLNKQMALKDAVAPPDALPPAVFSDTYSTARLQAVTANPPAGWEVKPAAGFFQDGSLLGTQAGQTLEFKFNATEVALYYEIRKDAAFISCAIDGKQVREFDSSWGPIYKFNRLNCVSLASGLPKGEHTLTITISEKKHELSNGHEFHLGYLMLTG